MIEPERLERFLKRARDDRPPAVVVGTDVTGLSVAQALVRHGVPVIGVDERRRGYLGYSSAFHFVQCPDFQGQGLIDLLEALAGIVRQRAMLVLTMDETVKLVARSGLHLRDLYHFDFPESDVVDVLMNKQRFTEHALANDLPLPRTECCETVAQVQQASRKFDYPVIMKPRLKNRESRMHAPRKTFLCSTPEQLLADYAVLSQWEAEVLVQEWIPGGDDHVYFSFHYFNGDGEDVASFEGRKLRQYIPDCGVTASAVGVPEPQVTELSRRILRDVSCRGFCSVEYKRDPRTGRYYIIEPTVGRVDLQLGVAPANGVDIVSRVYFSLIGETYPVVERPVHDVVWLRGKADLQAARFYVRRGDFTWTEYLRSLSGRRRFAVWGSPDRGLVLGWIRVTALGAMKLPFRAARKVYRAARRGITASGPS